jgi:hypothetical protein
VIAMPGPNVKINQASRKSTSDIDRTALYVT